ncbi:MAG: cytochrome c [Planctomycetota bacterium]
MRKSRVDPWNMAPQPLLNSNSAPITRSVSRLELPTKGALILIAAVLFVTAACSSEAGVGSQSAQQSSPPAAAPAAAPVTSAASAGHADDHHDSVIHNLRRWSDKLVQGAQPEGEAAFKELAAMGIKTAISVDGAIPAVELAAKYGITYVHVPIGYDGIDADAQARIVKAAQESQGPVFMHCHHGLHRGPAAAAVARMALEGVAKEQAYADLKESGCSPAYDGLYKVVDNFVPPTPAALAALGPLPSKVVPQGVQAAMVDIDMRWEFMKASKGKSWGALAEAPDKSPPHEAGILRELFREMQRDEDAIKRGPEFLAQSLKSEQQLSALEVALRAGDLALATTTADAIQKSCKACHTDFRD